METDNPEAAPSRKAVAARARSAEFHQAAVRLLQEGEHSEAQAALESAGAAARLEQAKASAQAARALMLKGAQQEALETAISGLRAL